jgi:hypothetical protein
MKTYCGRSGSSWTSNNFWHGLTVLRFPNGWFRTDGVRRNELRYTLAEKLKVSGGVK